VKYKTDNDGNVYFYKKGNINHLIKDIVKVSVKTVFSNSESFINKEFMEILTFIREGISLKKK